MLKTRMNLCLKLIIAQDQNVIVVYVYYVK